MLSLTSAMPVSAQSSATATPTPIATMTPSPTDTPVSGVFMTETPTSAPPTPTVSLEELTARMADVQDTQFRVNLFAITLIGGLLMLIFLRRR